MNKRVFLLIGLAVTLVAAVAYSQSKPRPVVGRSVVSTQLGIVAASHPLAARAGVEMLERGSNAVDAAIAANATIGLMEPAMDGIGGDLFVIYYEAKTGKLYGLNSGGRAPTGLNPEFLRSKGVTRMPGSGIYSVTVPGAVAGWDALRSRFGTKPFSELLAPAIYYADNGFPVSEVIARGWGTTGSINKLSQHPNTSKTFLIGGRAPKAGEIFRNPDLAKSLRLIGDEGRDGFYKGQTAQAILQRLVSGSWAGSINRRLMPSSSPTLRITASISRRRWKPDASRKVRFR